MERTPLVSIILPMYNAKDHIARCIESIRAQTFTDFELIIINDGSSDNVSYPICQMYAKVDPRILLIDKDNSGVSITRNRGIEMAAGKYLQFVDSDDYLAPDYTKDLVEKAEAFGADMVIAHYNMVIPRAGASALRDKGLAWAEKAAPAFAEKQREADELPPEVRVNGFLKEGLMDKNTFALHLMDKPAAFYYGVMWNKLYRRDIILAHDIRCNAEISWSEDFLFNLNYIRWAESFYATEKPGYFYVQNPHSICHTNSMNVLGMLGTKLMLLDYYKNLYKQLGLYEQNRMAINFYFVDVAESTQPTNPLVKSLNEGLDVVREALTGEDGEAGEKAEAPVVCKAAVPVHIRPAMPQDAGAIAEITTKELGYACTPEEVRQRLEAFLQRADQKIFVAEQAGSVIGYVHACDYELLYAVPMKNILALAVQKRNQQQGAGAALLDAVCVWARQTGAAAIRLSSGAARRKAHTFYRDYGFTGEKKQLRFLLPLEDTEKPILPEA
jgi:glycosyltransferase involved in cell wall biosynthesis/predicted N-acetyltransferase YhbS